MQIRQMELRDIEKVACLSEQFGYPDRTE
jgi:hypothetical protein